MKQKTLSFIPWILVVVLIGVVIYFVNQNKSSRTNPAPVNTVSTTTDKNNLGTIEYKNTDYDFSFILPKSWEGYTIITDEWQGYSTKDTPQGQELSETGLLISIRHPDWDYKAPRQDIPVMIFTLAQWNELSNDEFHIGAAPIGPRELGRNTKYVFAIPARYNFAFLVGFEEVDQIINDKNSFHTF